MIVSVYVDAAGNLFPRRDTDPAIFQGPPTGATLALTFDADTNAAIATDLWTNVALYSAANGKLFKGGVQVAISADGNTKAALDNMLSQADAAVATNDAFLALANPSNAQILAQVKALTRQNTTIIKRLKLLGRTIT